MLQVSAVPSGTSEASTMAEAVAPGVSSSLGGNPGLATREAWATWLPTASSPATPGNPKKVHVAVEVLVKMMTSPMVPAAPERMPVATLSWAVAQLDGWVVGGGSVVVDDGWVVGLDGVVGRLEPCWPVLQAETSSELARVTMAGCHMRDRRR